MSPRSGLRRAVRLAGALGAVVSAGVAFPAGALAAGTAGTTTVPSTSSPPSTSSASGTPSAAAPAPAALAVSLLPCAAGAHGGPCSADPAQLVADLSGDVVAVQVSWMPGAGRPSSAPAPASPSVILNAASSDPCGDSTPPAPSGTSATCWNWPSGLEHPVGGTSWILNGTYRVAPCSAPTSDNPCPASADYTSTTVAIAVAPVAPRDLNATSNWSAGTVSLTWKAGPEPDLVGYQVSRNSQAIYVCSVDGAGPGASKPCPQSLTFSDQPGSGNWTYSVTALRFGVDAAATHVVASAAVSVHAVIAASAPASIALPPAKSIGPVPTYAPAVPTPAPSSQTPPTTAGEDGAGVPSALDPQLPYGDNPAIGSPRSSAAAARETGSRTNLQSAAEIALAVIALSLAVHVWYITGQVRAAAARISGSRQGGKPAT